MLNNELTTIGLIIFGAQIAIKLFDKFFSNKIRRIDQKDEIELKEHQKRIERNDELIDIIKEFLNNNQNAIKEQNEKMNELFKHLEGVILRNQYTGKFDFDLLTKSYISLTLSNIEDELRGMIERNHITPNTLDITIKKLTNIIEKHINESSITLSNINHNKDIVIKISEIVINEKESMLELYSEVFRDYADSNKEKFEKKDDAVKSISETTKFFKNGLIIKLQKIIEIEY